MLFYGTPILYPIEIATTEGFRALLMANPLAVILEQARVWIIDPTRASAVEAAGGAAAPDPGARDLRRRPASLGWRVFTRQAPRIAEAL